MTRPILGKSWTEPGPKGFELEQIERGISSTMAGVIADARHPVHQFNPLPAKPVPVRPTPEQIEQVREFVELGVDIDTICSQVKLDWWQVDRIVTKLTKTAKTKAK